MKKTIYILSALLLGLVSCNKVEFEPVEKTKEIKESGLVAVTMKVEVPATTLIASTRALGDFSDTPSIKDIRVAVFGTSGYAQAYALAEPVDEDGNPISTYATTNFKTAEDIYYFKVLLPVYEGEAHVHIIANGPESIKFVEEDEETIMTAMATENFVGAYWARIVMPDGILTQLNDDGIMQTDDEGNFIPSEGTAHLFEDLVLIRNFAEVKLVNEATNLTDVSWTLVNVPTKGSVAPIASGTWVDDYKDYRYYYPDNTHTDKAKYGRMVKGDKVYNGFMFMDDTINETYPTADSWPTSTTTQGFAFGNNGMNFMYERFHPGGSKATCILLRGKYESDSYYTFYRIDLMNEDLGGYFPIYRNYRYQVRIYRVGNRGAKTTAEAMNRDSGGNVSMSTEAQSLTDISDGISRLYVEYVEKNFTSGGKKTLWVQYKPDGVNVDNTKIEMSIKTQGKALKNTTVPTTTAESSDTGYYIYEFELNDQSETEDLVSVLEIKADNGETGDNKSTLYRDITLRVLKKMDMTLSLVPKQVAGEGSSTILKIGLPDGLPSSMFPLEFHIEDINHSLYCTGSDGNGNNIIVPVKSDKSIVDGTTDSFYFIRTVNESEYIEDHTISTQFKTNVDASATTIYVENEFFKTQSINLLNDGMYVNPVKTTVPFDTTSVTINVEFAEPNGKNWTVTAGTGVTLDKTSGTGNGTFKMSFNVNTSTSDVTRTATVRYNGTDHTVTIIQKALEFSISPATKTVSGPTTTVSLKINAEEGKAWTASISGPEGSDPAPTLSKTSGEGTATITVTLPANTTNSSRNFTVTATMTDPERTTTATITQLQAPAGTASFNVDSFSYTNDRTGLATSSDGYVTINLSNLGVEYNGTDYWSYGYRPDSEYWRYLQMGYSSNRTPQRGGIKVTPVEGVKITGITITYSSSTYAQIDFEGDSTVQVSPGTYTRSNETGTWTGSSTSAVTFTNGYYLYYGTYYWPRIESIVVTYSAN